MEKQPQPERVQLSPAQEFLNQKEIKATQRLEMLREGHTVSIGGLELVYVNEEDRSVKVVTLRNPDTGGTVDIPLHDLADDSWQLVNPER